MIELELQCAQNHKKAIICVLLDNKLIKNEKLLCTDCMESYQSNTRFMGFRVALEMIEDNQKRKKDFLQILIDQDEKTLNSFYLSLLELKSSINQELDSLNKITESWIQHLNQIKSDKVAFSFHEELDKLIMHGKDKVNEINKEMINNQIEKLNSQWSTTLINKLNKLDISQDIQKCKAILNNLNFQNIEKDNQIVTQVPNKNTIQIYQGEYQQKQGYAQIDNCISTISENTEELKKLQQNDEQIEQKFEEIWTEITTNQMKQMNEIFEEFSLKQYKSISESFIEFQLKSDREKEYQRFFIEKINKNSPLQNQQPEKEQIMEQFQYELNSQQFEILDGSKSVNIYGDIFGQPIIDRLNRAQDSDILNINNYYQIELNSYFITKNHLLQYLKSTYGGFQDEFIKLFNSFKQENYQKDYLRKDAYQVLSQFFIIFQHFDISYDKYCLNDLLNLISNNPNYFYNLYKPLEERIVQALKKLIDSLSISQEKIVCKDVNFFQYFCRNYCYLSKMMWAQQYYFQNSQLCQNYLETDNDQIIVNYSQRFIPLDNNNYCLQYIADQKDQNNKQFFIKNCFDFFKKEMFEKNGWNKLYFQLYDIVLMKMRSNQNKSSIINNDQQYHDSDEEISSSNINLIQIIMSEIKLKVNQYNKQFAKFGVILNQIGERCIYYYSMFLIWRFSCYNKWKMLNNNYDKLKELKAEQQTKFEAAIKQNKVEQSQIKANSFARTIYSAFIEEYYQNNKKNVTDFIEIKNKKCFDIIKEQDKRLLEQYQVNSSQQQQNDEVMFYITDQKKFIENYANQIITQTKFEISQEHHQKLKQELNNFLYLIQQNINLISTQLQTQQKEGLKTINYFERQDSQKFVEVEFEQEMFKIVKTCILKEKNQNPNQKSIKADYKEYFQFDQFKDLPSKINVTMPSPSDEEIQSLKPYIQELLKQITKYLDECKNEKLNINKFDIQNALDKIKLNMIGCQESCPLCKRKCDQPNDNNHKHQCQNGHQLRGMNFVLIDDNPSLFTCEEIPDDMLITTQETSKVRTWKEIKQIYKDWDFKTLILQNDDNYQKQVKDKMMNVWNGGIGKLMCDVLSKKYNKTITYIIKRDLNKYEKDTSKVHYIFMLDDSGSMSGQAWTNAKNGAITCMEDIEKNPNAKVSVIIFNSNARVAIDCEKVNIKSQYDKITFQSGATSFENAFQLVFDQIQKHKKQNFESNIILFYTDGGDSYPQQAMNKFISLPLQQKKTISLILCSEESNPSTLSLMVINLKENGYVADLKTNIKVENVQKVWSEVVLKGVHVSD